MRRHRLMGVDMLPLLRLHDLEVLAPHTSVSKADGNRLFFVPSERPDALATRALAFNSLLVADAVHRAGDHCPSVRVVVSLLLGGTPYHSYDRLRLYRHNRRRATPSPFSVWTLIYGLLAGCYMGSSSFFVHLMGWTTSEWRRRGVPLGSGSSA